MAVGDHEKSAMQKLRFPAAVGLAGAGAGLLLTNKPKVRAALPGLKNVGDLADDLKEKLETVLGKDSPSTRESVSRAATRRVDADELRSRRRERAEHRSRRRRTSGG
jgi:hypothetical protein